MDQRSKTFAFIAFSVHCSLHVQHSFMVTLTTSFASLTNTKDHLRAFINMRWYQIAPSITHPMMLTVINISEYWMNIKQLVTVINGHEGQQNCCVMFSHPKIMCEAIPVATSMTSLLFSTFWAFTIWTFHIQEGISSAQAPSDFLKASARRHFSAQFSTNCRVGHFGIKI